jgi:REP element-mobilizing transposase RayT
VHRGWSLLAAHVRSNHVHTVVEAEVPPERVMGDFKAYASRRLNRMSLDAPNRKRWARHGSTRWLWQPQHVSAAMQYVVRVSPTVGACHADRSLTVAALIPLLCRTPVL